MKLRDALILGVLLTGLFVSEVVIKRFGGIETNDLDQPTATREYYFDEAVLMVANTDGTPAVRLRAAKIRSPMDSGNVNLEDVALDMSEDPDNSWSLRADYGHVVERGEFVTFTGNVLLRQEGDHENPLRISTETLKYSPATSVVTTDAAVQIETFGKLLTSQGMTAYLMEDRLELQSDVHGSFVP